MKKSESDKYKLPPGKIHRWLVILDGEVVPDEPLIAATYYLARDMACSKYQCERHQVAIGLLPTRVYLAIDEPPKKRIVKKKIVKKTTTRSKKK